MIQCVLGVVSTFRENTWCLTPVEDWFQQKDYVEDAPGERTRVTSFHLKFSLQLTSSETIKSLTKRPRRETKKWRETVECKIDKTTGKNRNFLFPVF